MWILLSLELTPALACTIVGPELFELDPLLQDDEPPAPPEVLGVAVERGRGPRGGLVVSISTSCDSIGRIHLSLARPEGDPDGEDAVGYYLEKVDGDLPAGLSLPLLKTIPWLGPEIVLTWEDGAEDEQEPFDFTLALIPVDRAGNEGEPALVVVSDEGKTECGCRQAPGPGTALPMLALAALWRRSRGRSVASSR